MSDSITTYLNHAGTSWPKPYAVREAVEYAMQQDPMQWPEMFATARRSIVDFFQISDASRLLLTPTCTTALSIAVEDQVWNPGDVVLTSSFEHHALHRPLFKLIDRGVDLEVLPRTESEPFILEKLEARLKSGKVKMVAISAASNVTGELLPVAETIRLAHQYNALVLIDGAQTTGWDDLDLPALGADLYCFAGHKGPHAPWGIGGLYVANDVCMNSLSSQCEVNGANNESKWHSCSELPNYCDSGSANIWAMVGMAAATQWLNQPEQENRLARCRELASQLYEGLSELEGVSVYGPKNSERRMPTVAISCRQMKPGELGSLLRREGIITSYGLQCAPLAHRNLGTGPYGVVRFSCGPSNHQLEIERCIGAVKSILRK